MIDNINLKFCPELVDNAKKIIYDTKIGEGKSTGMFREVKKTITSILVQGAVKEYFTPNQKNYLETCVDNYQRVVLFNNALNRDEKSSIASLFNDLSEIAFQYSAINPKTGEKRIDRSLVSSLGVINSIITQIGGEKYIDKTHLNSALSLIERVERDTGVNASLLREETEKYLEKFKSFQAS